MKKSLFTSGTSVFFNKVPATPIPSVLFRKMSTIVMPGSGLDTSLIENYEKILNNFRESRQDFNAILSKHLSLGKEKMADNLYDESIRDFDIVIVLATGDPINKLSLDERKIIAEAYMHKAKVLSYGSTNEVMMAIENLNKALELNPKLKMAKTLRNSITAKWPVSILTADELDGKTKTHNQT